MNDKVVDHSTQAINVGSKSFAAAAKLFDERTRQSAVMLYAWCRHCDDVIDGQALGFETDAASQDTSEARLERLRESTRLAYADAPMSEPAFAAFQEVALTHQIPQSQAFDHL